MASSLMAIPMMPLAAKGATMASDEATRKVQDLLDRWLAAWNASDMDAMFALFRADAHWVNIVGMHWKGRAEVEHAHRVYFDLMFKGVHQSLEAIESIVPVAGGAVTVVARWSLGAFKTPDGHLNPPSRDRMSLVLVPEGDRFVIVHGANIAIVEEAQRFDPALKGVRS
jgi:uncharacterized protein (TIGR02246 family)